MTDEFKLFEEAWNKFWTKHKRAKNAREAEVVLQVKRRIADIHDLILELREEASK